MQTAPSPRMASVRPFNNFSEIVEIIPAPSIITDLSGVMVASNYNVEELFGYSFNEMHGSSIDMLIPDAGITEYINNHAEFDDAPRQKTVVVTNNAHGIHKSGREIPIEIQYGSFKKEDGSYIVMIIADATDHYWEKKHLKERDQRLRIISESTKAIPWAADPAIREFKYVGPQAVDLLGYPLESWYEKKFWINKIHPDDRQATVNKCNDSSKYHDNYDLEYRMVKSNGEVVWFHDIVNVEYKNGLPFMLRGFLVDITDKKDAEKILQEEKQFSDNIIDSLPGLFFMIDRQHRYVRWNKNAEEKLNSNRDKLNKSVATNYISTAYRDNAIRSFEKGFREGSFNAEYEKILKDGNSRLYSSYGIRTNIGGHDYLVGYEIDISKQKKMEMDANRLRNELAHVNRLATAGELTTSIVHELNQPLAAIMSNTQAVQNLLKKEEFNLDEINAAFADIISDDKRAVEIINQLRKLLKKEEQEYKQLNLVDLIAEVSMLVRNEAKNKGVSILNEEPSEKVSFVLGNNIQIQQVILNIMLNAFDAMEANEHEPGKLIIRIIKNGLYRLTTEFIDNGIGFADQDIEQLFEAFSTSKKNGMGMGLSISRTIIEAHGGQMGAMRNKNGGATFFFSLPITVE
jgi:PAS domain S-box-containing protein